MNRLTFSLGLVLAASLAGCAVGPDYVRPAFDAPPAYKEGERWAAAEPSRADSREPWWQVYRDDTLNGLIAAANGANQNIRQAEAQYRQARAVVDAARAGFSPTVGASLSATRSHVDSPTQRTANGLGVSLGASWEPDLWGGVRRQVEAGEAGAAASADDLAAARLSIQTTLAQDYLQLRFIDIQIQLYANTTAAYERALKLTQAQYGAGVVLRSDVALAEAQLASAQAQAVDLEASRAPLEHAIAILTGQPPASFSLPALVPADGFAPRIPDTPVGLPSELLQRRPDIAAAERRAALANANIGVARSAYYPSLTLSGSGGGSAAVFGSLLDAPSRVWSLGAVLAQTLFDGGLRRARDAQAVAAFDIAVAQYKQTVLAGFQQVEDDLATLRILEREAAVQARAVTAAKLAEQLALTQYRGGTVNYLSVVTAQTLSLTNQRAAVQLRGRQLAASVALIAAVGGGFDAADGSTAASSTATRNAAISSAATNPTGIR